MSKYKFKVGDRCLVHRYHTINGDDTVYCHVLEIESDSEGIFLVESDKGVKGRVPRSYLTPANI